VNKRRVSTFLSAKVFNKLVLAAARAGLPLPGVVILETAGRKSGIPRRVPVTRLIEGDTLWIVTEHGLRAAYVRNIEANPSVRVRAGRRWRPGTAHLLPDLDWRALQRRMPSKLSSATVRLMGTEHLTIRVDLDPASASGAPRSAAPAPESPRSG
jgi:deazaflavin-dependent oxidoreductase (nitroreductase family)